MSDDLEIKANKRVRVLSDRLYGLVSAQLALKDADACLHKLPGFAVAKAIIEATFQEDKARLNIAAFRLLSKSGIDASLHHLTGIDGDKITYRPLDLAERAEGDLP